MPKQLVTRNTLTFYLENYDLGKPAAITEDNLAQQRTVTALRAILFQRLCDLPMSKDRFF